MGYTHTHTHHNNNNNNNNNTLNKLPKRIILVRHGESRGNTNPQTYSTIADHKIPLTAKGVTQSRNVGYAIRRLLDNDNDNDNDNAGGVGVGVGWRVYFYVSPYERARSTLRELGRAFPRRRVIGVREECRIREQDFGNFQVVDKMEVIQETRERFGRFFFRFPDGESAADVYDRVSSFMESLWRDIDLTRLHPVPGHDLNLIIVTHGLSSRVFLMKWFKWTVEEFELLNNPENGEYRVMELGEGGDYSLAINHTEQELLEWGLSSEMIADQKWRIHARRGERNEKCSWYLDGFFDHLEDGSDSSAEDGSNDPEEDRSDLCAEHDQGNKANIVGDSYSNGIEDKHKTFVSGDGFFDHLEDDSDSSAEDGCNDSGEDRSGLCAKHDQGNKANIVGDSCSNGVEDAHKTFGSGD